MSSLCRLSGCPYFNPHINQESAYGCNRFSTPRNCPTASALGLDTTPSQYEIFGDVDINLFKATTEAWMKEDKQYQEDLLMQKEEGKDLYPFPSREIL